MRNLIILLLVFSSLICEANVKDSIPNGLPQNPSYGWTRTYKQSMADSGFVTLFNDSVARPKYPMIKMLTYDHKPWYWDGTKWNPFAAPSTSFVKYSDSTTIFVTPTQLGDSGFVKISDSNSVFITPTLLSDSLIWARSGTFVYPKSNAWNVGIGGVPQHKFEIQDLGRLYYNNGVLTLFDDVVSQNMKIGYGAGTNVSGMFNIALGAGVFANAQGSANVGIGAQSSNDIVGGQNTSMGGVSAKAIVGDYNTSIGYYSNNETYGSNNTAVGSFSQNANLVFADSLSNTTFAIGTSTITGASVASFITSASLSIGIDYIFRMDFGAYPPAPFDSSAVIQIYRGTVTNSNTITFHAFITVTSQRSGNYLLSTFNKQNNSIAIGYNVNTPASNTTMIGNTNNIMTYLGGGALDIPTSTTPTPASGHAVLWFDGTSVKLTKNVLGVTTTTTIF